MEQNSKARLLQAVTIPLYRLLVYYYSMPKYTIRRGTINVQGSGPCVIYYSDRIRLLYAILLLIECYFFLVQVHYGEWEATMY